MDSLKEIDKALIATLKKHSSVINLPIIKLNQSTKQGMTKGIFFSRVGSEGRGLHYRNYDEAVVSPDINRMQEEMHRLITYRWSILSDDAHSDIHTLRELFQTLAVTQELNDKYGIGSLVAGNIVHQVVVDESDNYIDHPSFTMTYAVVGKMTLGQRYIDGTDIDIYRI